MRDGHVRWGIMGPGRIAHKFAEALTVVDGAVLGAVASRSTDRAHAFASKYSIPRHVGSYEELASDKDIDVVYIATPHRFHAENVRLCLENDKAVLCEKPLTVTAGETEAIVRLAGQRKLFLMEALWSRFLPIYEVLREWLENGAIGAVRLMTSTFGIQIHRDETGRLLNPDLAGGVLLDMGIYNIAISQWVTGEEPHVVDAQCVMGPTGVDELVSASLKYGSDVVSQFTCNFGVNTANDFWIYGTRGHIRIHPRFWQSTQATLSTDQGDETVVRDFRKNGFEYQIDEVVSCIRAGQLESPVMPHAATLSTMRVMDRIRSTIGVRYAFES